MVRIFSSLDKTLESVPLGSIKLLIINGKKIGLAQTNKGLFAFDNNCPHQREPLHKGMITPYGEVTCPLHHYRFDLRTGQETENRCPSMKVYSLITNETGVFIDI